MYQYSHAYRRSVRGLRKCSHRLNVWSCGTYYPGRGRPGNPLPRPRHQPGGLNRFLKVVQNPGQTISINPLSQRTRRSRDVGARPHADGARGLAASLTPELTTPLANAEAASALRVRLAGRQANDQVNVTGHSPSARPPLWLAAGAAGIPADGASSCAPGADSAYGS